MSELIIENRLKTYAGFLKIEHTVFSLPLMFAGALLHRAGPLTAGAAGLIICAGAGARAMAMGLNRLIDAEIDARNPRTQQRALPRGAMRRWEAWLIVAAAGALYLSSAWALAPVCLWLSPIPVALFVMYPYLKRFTALAHLGLGLAWSMAPVGGWLAASRSLAGIREVGWLWLFSIAWVAGFDIIYATLDEAFDREEGLRSLPVALGKRPALFLASLVHIAAFVCLWMVWRTQLRTMCALWWLAAIGALFIWQHAIAARNPEFAFFQLNGMLGFLVFAFVWAGV